jgi:hypothetical protein
MSDQKPPTRKYHYVSIAIGFFILCCVGYQIVRTTNKTTIAAGGSQVNYYDVPKIPLLGGGCMRLKADIYWQKDPAPGVTGQKQEVKK